MLYEVITDDAVDARIEVAHPGHRVEETQVADDTAIAHDLHRQPSARAQAVRYRLTVERVQDMVPATDEFLAQRRDSYNFV